MIDYISELLSHRPNPDEYGDPIYPNTAKLTYLSKGMSRSVYRCDDKVIKLDHTPNLNLGNKKEWANYQRLSTLQLPEPFAIPRTELISVPSKGKNYDIIVMEYIAGRTLDPCENDALMTGFNIECHMFDCYGSNVIEFDNKLWLVDLEC